MAHRYLEAMNVLRHILTCLSISIIVAISVNSLAMAANDLSHQMHCLEAGEDLSVHATANYAHDHDRIAVKQQTPGHDHETCMIHAYPALSAEAVKLRKLADTLLTTLVWPEAHAYTLEHGDALKRPPKS